MIIIKSKYFGDIDIDKIEECYECELQYKSAIIFPLLLFEKAYFSTKKIQEKDVKAADFLIDNFEQYIDNSYKPIIKSFNKKGEVFEYIEHHFEEFDKTDLTKLGVDSEQSKKKLLEAILSKMHFTGMIIDPTKEEEALTLDFTISKELTQYIIAIKMNKEGKVSQIEMES